MELRDVIHFYLGCHCVVNLKRYISGTGVNFNIETVDAIFNSINRNSHIDQCWGISVNDENGFVFLDCFNETRHIYDHFIKIEDIKLELRPITALTDKEKTEISKMVGWWEGKIISNEHHLNVAHDTMKEMVYDSLVTADNHDADRLGPSAYFMLMPYLCKQGIDIFKLIESRQAIEDRKQKKL